MPGDYLHGAAAKASRGLDVLVSAQREYGGAHDAGKARYLAYSERNYEVYESVAQGGENGHGQKHGRYGHEHVDESHEQGVRPPAEIARRAAYDAACDEGYGYRRYAAEERDAPAVEYACQQVPSELVRTQGVFCAGAAQLVENILVYHIAVGHIERRQEHGKNHDPQKHDSSHCQLVPGEARCGQLPAAALQMFFPLFHAHLLDGEVYARVCLCTDQVHDQVDDAYDDSHENDRTHDDGDVSGFHRVYEH